MNEIKRQKQLKQRQAWRAAGLCYRCGKPADGLSRCRVCLDKQKAWHKDTLDERREQINSWNKNSRRRLREDVINGYGGQCSCCGEREMRYLQLDHVNGGGKKERDSLGNDRIWTRLRRESYPPGMQVLCANCHNAKTFYGGCVGHYLPA